MTAQYSKEIKKVILAKKDSLGIAGEIKSIKISEVGIGENNLNMLAVVNGKHKLLFRIAMRAHLEKNMKKEFETLKLIPECFGPEPIYLDGSKNILPKTYSVLRYIKGKHIKRWTDRHLKMHAKKLAQLHKRKYPYFGTLTKKTTRFDMYKLLLKEIRAYRKDCPELFEDHDINLLLPKIKRYIKEHNILFTSLRQSSLTHSDICITNILFTKKGIRYIDWEHAKFWDNAVDVAMIFDPDTAQPPWKIKLTDRQSELYLNTYLRYIKDKTLKERVQVWTTYLKCTDMLFLKWKVMRYDKEPVKALPKKHYAKCAENVVKSIKKKFY
ncbi:MAG: phosphotransferase [Candidatus Woesearchaeota archaeon]